MDFEEVDLAPVAERVEWAGRHVERLRKLVSSYVDTRPVYVHLTKSQDGATVVETATLTAGPPLPLSLVLGDVAHHLRAALDNLVGAVRVGGPTESSAFPIAHDRKAFDRRAGSTLQGVPRWAVDAIRELQPFSPSQPSVGRDLAIIDQMAQRDRHRALLLHAPILDIDELTLTYRDDFAAPGYLHIRHDRSPGGAYESRYPAGSLVRTEYQVRVVVGEDVEGALDQEVVALAEGWLRTLREVVEFMEETMDARWRAGNEITGA